MWHFYRGSIFKSQIEICIKWNEIKMDTSFLCLTSIAYNLFKSVLYMLFLYKREREIMSHVLALY